MPNKQFLLRSSLEKVVFFFIYFFPQSSKLAPSS